MGNLREFIENILTRRRGDDELEKFYRMDKLVESAKRLLIIYTYEKNAYLTDIFLDTLRIIDEEDIYWKSYLHFLDKGDAHALSVAHSIALALVSIHAERLEVEPIHEVGESSLLISDYLVLRAQEFNLTEEERIKDIDLPRVPIDAQSEEWLKRQARIRHEWFYLFDFLIFGYPPHA